MTRLTAHLLMVGGAVLSLCSEAAAAALPFGQVTTGTISSVAQSNTYSLSANVNDIVNLTMVTTNGSLRPTIELYDSAGKQINIAFNGFCGGQPVEMNGAMFPSTATYTVLVRDCGNTNTGTYVIFAQRTNNPAGVVALPFGGQPLSGTVSSAAQSNALTFSANSNDIVNLTMVTTTGALRPTIDLYDSTGKQINIAYNGFCGGRPVEMNGVKLPSTGSYNVLLRDCGDTNTGTYVIFAQRTNNPAGSVALLFGGQPQTGAISSAAQSKSYTFGGSANDVINMTMATTNGNLRPTIELYDSTGKQISIAYNGFCGGQPVQMNGVKLPQTGSYTVLVRDCGDTNTGNYNLSAQCFGVCTSPGTQLPQTITFAPLSNQVLGTAPLALSASASSGLPVTFTSNATSVCTVSGATVTLVAVGTCSVTASQSGNSNYAPASPVTQTFTVTAGGGPTSSVTYDLSADWSNSSNPSGLWSINQGSKPLPLVPVWTAPPSTTLLPCNMPAWAPSNSYGNFLPAFFKLNACATTLFASAQPNAPNNVVAGDILLHTVDSYNGNPSLAARGGNSSLDFRVPHVRTRSRMIIRRHIVPTGYSDSDRLHVFRISERGRSVPLENAA